ncbi:MAG: WecB/TagA/CpsF family glycosyltransferase [Candidatus Methanomethylicaceae archaeon]
MEGVERVNILGVGISAINMTIGLEIIEGWIARQESHYVCVTPVHSVMECQRDPGLRRIWNASGLTTPDGMPLVWLARLKGFHHVDRVYGPDLMLALCERSVARGYRHFFYGGAEGVPEQLADVLQKRFPGLQVAGMYSPPFRPLTPEEDERIVQMLNEANPDIVWVGLGSPKQEYWMAGHRARLTAPVLIGVGAAFDFLTGRKPQAPRWMQRAGLEWLFRLLTEPRRLWPRYRQYPRFVWLVLQELLNHKKD